MRLGMCAAAAAIGVTIMPCGSVALAQPVSAAPPAPFFAQANASASAAIARPADRMGPIVPPLIPPAQQPGPVPASATAVQPTAADVPTNMPPPVRVLSPEKPLKPREQAVVTQAARWQGRPARTVTDAQGWVHYPFGNSEITVVCAVLHICDIELQPGEHVLGPPDISDPRWIVHPRFAIDGGVPVTHVEVKPSDVGLDGNIVLHTDRRTYSIRLVSTTSKWIPMVKFDYPDDESNADEWTGPALSGAAGNTGSGGTGDPCDGQPMVPPSAFKISGPRTAWTPKEVFVVSTPVGEKTCIEFNAEIGSHALPSLVALANDGTWFSDATPVMVNFRYVRRRYEVDMALDHFALVRGVGSDQTKVEVRRAGQ